MRATLHDRAPNTYYGQWLGKRRCLRVSNRPPLPIMSSRRAPDSLPLTFRSEISQRIARRRVGNFCIDHKEKSAHLAKGRAPGDDHALTASIQATALQLKGRELRLVEVGELVLFHHLAHEADILLAELGILHQLADQAI